MLALTGTIKRIKKVEGTDKNFYDVVLVQKKRNTHISFLVFEEDVIKQIELHELKVDDYVEVVFYVKAKEFNDKYYNNLYAIKIYHLK
jgi:hypothetical protein